MGPGLRDRIRQAAPLATRARLGLCALALLLAGCGVEESDARERARQLLHDGGEVIGEELGAIVGSCVDALGDLQAALDALGTSPQGRFDAVEATRKRHGLSGLIWTGPGKKEVWAGRVIEPRTLPAPQPWHRSFRKGSVTYHAGPFVRAIVVGPTPVSGGAGYATWILEESGPDQIDERPFARRWLEPLDLWEVGLLHPEDPAATAEPSGCCRVVPVAGPGGEAVIAAALHVPEIDALRERLEADQAGVGGVLLLLLLVGAIIVLVRYGLMRIRQPMLRWVSGAALVLLVRGVLRLLDLPNRFPPLMEAFSPSEFAVDTPLGWLASPGDFALTSVAYLLVAICATAAIRPVAIPRHLPGRLATLAAALLTCGLACGLWLRLVEVAVEGGQTRFFEASDFVPRTTAALMLVALVALTATTYLLAHVVLRRGLRSLPPWTGTTRRTVLIVLAVGATWFLSTLVAQPHWIVLAIPLVAGLVARRVEGRFGLALPSRALVLSVLATALAYPVLWERVGGREGAALEEELRNVLSSENIAQAGVAAALANARDDTYLRAGLAEAATGSRPEGLALQLWLQSSAHWQRHPAAVAVLDDQGRMLDRFALESLPPRLLPAPRMPSSTDVDEEIFISRGDHLRCVVGRLRLRDEAGRELGFVVITVPDLMDLRLRGLAGLAAHRRTDAPLPPATQDRLQYAALKSGRVVASSDPSLSRAAGSFGPAALAELDAERPSIRWNADNRQGHARWDPDRAAVFAVRQPAPTMGDALLALARLVVVGVGCGLAAAVALLIATLGSFRLHLHHKILLSYFVISVIPIVLLGIASARETQDRHDARLTERLQTDITRARGELELMGALVFDSADSQKLEEWAPQRRHDVLLYREGVLEAASRTGLVAAELLPSRLPAPAYQATVLEQRQTVRRDAQYAGRRVWFAFAPVLDAVGRTRATVGVPLLYEADRLDEQVTVTGSVLLAAYMLTLVLVLVGGLYVARRLTRPLGALAEGTKRVSAGDLDVELEGEGSDEFGQLVAAFNAMTDDLREASMHAARAERESAWRRMASQVAHEIKNPLTPMRLMLQQMEADVLRDPDKAAEALKRTTPLVLRQIEGLDRIARDFANFARLPKRRTIAVDVGELVREVTSSLAGAEADGIRVRCEVADDLPPVHWDPGELRRVLLNVVLNAMESIEESGEVRLEAVSSARGDRPGVKIGIEDEGAGIPPEHIERLFEPQFSTKTRGTGLGLAIVSRIIADMGGTIDVESTPGVGSTFEVWWPAGEPAPAE